MLHALVAASSSAAPVAPAVQNREMRAREAFAAGHYQEALDSFVTLYAETLHPNYLRNIGRCYQNLQNPDKAISSFREYLRKAKNLPADEKREIRSYIAEMEALKKEQEGANKPERPSPAPEPPPPAEPRTLAPAAREPPAASPLTLTAPAQPAASPPAFYKRWWFWALVGGAVAAGAAAAGAAAIAVSSSSGGDRPGCDPTRICR
jgi:tetratricopeptide (TPR) repeat protein